MNLPSRDELMHAYARLQTARANIAARRAGGNTSKQGRYTAPETARMRYIMHTGIVQLKFGKLPRHYDFQMLEMPPDQKSLLIGAKHSTGTLARNSRMQMI